MNQKRKVIIYGLVAFVAGFVLLRWFLLTGLGLMVSSWFIFENLWILEPGEHVNWPKVAKKAGTFMLLGLLADMLLQI